jgi:hypothetical protein
MKQTPLTKLEELEPIDRYNGRNGKKLENNGVATDEVVDEATEDEAVDEPSPKPRSKIRSPDCAGGNFNVPMSVRITLKFRDIFRHLLPRFPQRCSKSW